MVPPSWKSSNRMPLPGGFVGSVVPRISSTELANNGTVVSNSIKRTVGSI